MPLFNLSPSPSFALPSLALTRTPPTVGELFYLGDNCLNCTAHAAATQAYIEAKEITNDWELVKYYVNTTGAQ